MTQINWDGIVTSRVLPAGFYNLRIASAELVNNSYNGLLQINLELRVEAPEVAKGKAHYEFLTLGKSPFKTIKDEWGDDFKEYAALNDPNFEDPRVQQRSRELKMFKRMLECAGYQFPSASSLEEVLQLSVGKVFTARVVVSQHEFGKRAGEDRNEIDGIFPFGTETPRLERDNRQDRSKVAKPSDARPVATTTAIRPVPNMSQPTETVEFFNDED